MTLSCLIAARWKDIHHSWINYRRNWLARQVEDFNSAMDGWRFQDAHVIAMRAKKYFAEETVVVNMEWKSNFVLAITQGRVEEGMCGTPSAYGAASEQYLTLQPAVDSE